MKNIMERLGVGEDDVIENRLVSSAIQQAQSRIEGHNFDIRKYVLEYDDVMNKHRETVYSLRRRVLLENQAQEIIRGWLAEEWSRFNLDQNNGEGAPGHGDLLEKYATREKELGEEQMRMIGKLVLLRVIDELWVDHLTAMDYLRSSVSLRAFGQRDPLAEYKVEGQRMFTELIATIKGQVVDLVFKASIAPQSRFSFPQSGIENRGSSMPLASGPFRNMTEGHANIGDEQGAMEKEMGRQEPEHKEHKELGRNDPCWCGSGKKYKKCGLLNTSEHQKLMAQK